MIEKTLNINNKAIDQDELDFEKRRSQSINKYNIKKFKSANNINKIQTNINRFSLTSEDSNNNSNKILNLKKRLSQKSNLGSVDDFKIFDEINNIKSKDDLRLKLNMNMIDKNKDDVYKEISQNIKRTTLNFINPENFFNFNLFSNLQNQKKPNKYKIKKNDQKITIQRLNKIIEKLNIK